MLKTLAVLMLVIHSGESKTPDKLKTATQDCRGHEYFGDRLQCIGSRYTAGNITDEVASLWTHEALRLLPTTQSYYSVGMTVGTEYKLIVGRQDSFAFDWALTLPARVYNMFSADTVLLNNPVGKPLLIYSVVKTDVQALPDWKLSVQMPYHTDDMKPLYRHTAAQGGPLRKDCSAFEKWDKRELMKRSGIAVIMPSNMWCPEAASAFEVYIAVIDFAGERDSKKLWYMEWYRSAAEDFGSVPSWVMNQDFQ